MIQTPSPLERIEHPLFEEKQLEVYIKRDDLIHPEIMGNKWRKLKYNLAEAQDLGHKTLVTVGGGYSNHIAATAAAGRVFGFKTVGIIRGHELSESSNETLLKAKENGMHFRFVDRETFRTHKNDASHWLSHYPDGYFLPEGGTNHLAVKGAGELVDEIPLDFDTIITPIGSGGTFCGVLSRLKPHQKAIGVSALKGDFMRQEVKGLMSKFNIQNTNYELILDAHHGGFAKTSAPLIDFWKWFKVYFHVPLDLIYTSKSFLAFWHGVHNGLFEAKSKIILVHTGGLQGITENLLKNRT